MRICWSGSQHPQAKTWDILACVLYCFHYGDLINAPMILLTSRHTNTLSTGQILFAPTTTSTVFIVYTHCINILSMVLLMWFMVTVSPSSQSYGVLKWSIPCPTGEEIVCCGGYVCIPWRSRYAAPLWWWFFTSPLPWCTNRSNKQIRQHQRLGVPLPDPWLLMLSLEPCCITWGTGRSGAALGVPPSFHIWPKISGRW